LKLQWFAQGFLSVTVENDRLLVADLRMGQHPNYVLTHVVAARSNPSWIPVHTELLPTNFDRGLLGEVWNRIWKDVDLPSFIEVSLAESRYIGLNQAMTSP
jgi:hypothetical protein